MLLLSYPDSIKKKNAYGQTPFALLKKRLESANPYEKNLSEVKEALYEILQTAAEKTPTSSKLSVKNKQVVVDEFV
jgi:hypothetical protein